MRARLREVRILLVGDKKVGKSRLIERIIYNSFEASEHQLPDSCTYGIKKIEVDGMPIKIVVSKKGPSQDLDAAVKNGGIDIIMLVYDITKESSFKKLEEFLITKKAYSYAIVGTKSDLVHNQENDSNVVLEFAKDHGITVCLETSAKENWNIDAVFHAVIKQSIKKIEMFEPQEKFLEAKVDLSTIPLKVLISNMVNKQYEKKTIEQLAKIPGFKEKVLVYLQKTSNDVLDPILCTNRINKVLESFFSVKRSLGWFRLPKRINTIDQFMRLENEWLKGYERRQQEGFEAKPKC